MSVLSEDTKTQSRKALKSLISHERNEKGDLKQTIYLIINTDKPLAKQTDHVPRIIPIPNRISKSTDNSILLVTKDPSTPYREPLTCKNSPTEDLFNEIMPLKKLRIISKSKKSLKKLYHEYDLIVCDHRIHHLLPSVLGEQFFKGHKKVPYMLQMSKPDPSAQPVKKQDRVETCDAKYVRDQIRSICKNTSFIPNKDTTISIKIGWTDTEDIDKLITNIFAVVEFLKNPKFQPIGGLLKYNNQIKGMFVKTNESISLPIYKRED
ncbi:50S ribosomal protein L1 [Wickerhamomyces ciferrii]|uniref:50S ribosomal protein L1 n=1 Tax=Wickerhamomyces ciferrii (strain ATCC 14091 / BCRC 22168 / CBS 111 / JCM 3599 / NBRC 0793 / NRRL Y-1031 F-60-10) TaxID=1206466 RepID=K0KTI9_WICCF|nr:50S ribosomal protein L1 [Wickerhamomyces ciferrii]CCH44694.1 50S ribosomal protein L1 [Wickerhamomyces ciferrii]